MTTKTNQPDLIAEVENFLSLVGNCGVHPDKAERFLRRLVQELKCERDLRGNAEEEIAQHNACDKCDLCEDHQL